MITLKKEEEESKNNKKKQEDVVLVEYIDFYRLHEAVANLLQIKSINKELLLEEIDPYFEEAIREEIVYSEFLNESVHLTRPVQGLIPLLDFSFSLKCEVKNYIYVTFIYVPRQHTIGSFTSIVHTYYIFVLKRPE